jgi:UDP-N-acetylmuramate dehydrogenase
MNWWKRSNIELRRNEPLSGHTTFRLGGPADYFARPADITALRQLLEAAARRGLPLRVIGAGSNLLVSDKGVRALVISLSAPSFCRIRRKGVRLTVGAGVRLNRLVAYCSRKGLAGAEFLCGIPGTLGGALVMNAGISVRSKGALRRLWIGDLVESVTIMHYNGAVQKIRREEIAFDYRSSSLNGAVILGAQLRMRPGRAKAIAAVVASYRNHRLKQQDIGSRSAGCVFKNPAGGLPAGKLIDDCGGKCLSCGTAAVSQKHANFIIASGQATAADVRKLMRLIQARVKKRFGLTLEPEIELWQ